MLSKKFYMEYASPMVQRMVRHQIRPYPGESALQDNYQTEIEWLEYKKQLIEACTSRRPLCAFN
jgi:hypothetical protein